MNAPAPWYLSWIPVIVAVSVPITGWLTHRGEHERSQDHTEKIDLMRLQHETITALQDELENTKARCQTLEEARSKWQEKFYLLTSERSTALEERLTRACAAIERLCEVSSGPAI